MSTSAAAAVNRQWLPLRRKTTGRLTWNAINYLNKSRRLSQESIRMYSIRHQNVAALTVGPTVIQYKNCIMIKH